VIYIYITFVDIKERNIFFLNLFIYRKPIFTIPSYILMMS